VGKRISLAGLAALLVPLLLLPGLSRAMQSTHYALNWDVIGAGGGPASSGSFAVNATLGQGVVGPAASTSFQVSAGYWLAGGQYSLYLPVLMRDYSTVAYADPCGPDNDYCEDYDTYQDAYGPLQPNATYDAYPEDTTDYYYFELSESGSVTVRVTNYQADGQLLLRDSNVVQIDVDYEPAGGDGVLEVAAAGLAAGKYYIQIYTTPTYENPNALYSLTLTID